MDWTARNWGLVRMAVTRSALLREEKCVDARDREGSERSCLLRMVRVCLSRRLGDERGHINLRLACPVLRGAG
jgi:hypothetical protein